MGGRAEFATPTAISFDLLMFAPDNLCLLLTYVLINAVYLVCG